MIYLNAGLGRALNYGMVDPIALAGRTMDIRLLDFTQRSLAAGIRRQEIATVLRRAKWAEPEIEAALGAFAELDFAIPVPRPKPYLSARETFIYLILFAALYATAFDLGALLFDLINRAFPDPVELEFAWRSEQNIRWHISALIVAFPVFAFVFRAMTRAVTNDPTKRGSLPRKWLTYLTLFVAGFSLAGDVVMLVYNLLGGELTVRFALKVATVAIIAGGSFAFFLGDMRKEEKS